VRVTAVMRLPSLLVTHITMIRLKEVAAAEALALGRTLHWQTQKFEPPSLQDHSFEANKIRGKRNKTKMSEPNE
jgi:hypothetical protein